MRKALSTLGQADNWLEWDRDGDGSPAYVKKYGSPTVLVDGKDVSGADGSSDENCCRIYSNAGGQMAGVPPAAMIVKALSEKEPGRGGWLGVVGAVPATIVALIPAFTCPSCWPIYIGLMSALGIGAYDFSDSLMPIMIVALVISLFSLAFRASRRHGYRPFFIGAVASGMLLAGKTWLANDLMMYAGTVLLIGASVWNSLKVKRKIDPPKGTIITPYSL